MVPVARLLPPRNSATKSKIKTAAPATQTHGEVYHSVVCSVVMLVVVVVLEEAESWARSTNCIKLKTNKLINVLNVKTVADFLCVDDVWSHHCRLFGKGHR